MCVSYLRRWNDELASQLREAKKEESRLKNFFKEADIKTEKLNSELFELQRRIGSKSTTAEPESTPARNRAGTQVTKEVYSPKKAIKAQGEK